MKIFYYYVFFKDQSFWRAFPVLCSRPYRSLALYIIQRDKKKQVSRLNETVSRLVDLHMYRRYERLLSEN